jgi:hypothetical protein
MPLFLRFCHFFYGANATFFTVLFLKSHFLYGVIATISFFCGSSIAFEKEILYNSSGGNWKMGKYERDNLSLDNQVVKSNKMIQRKI